MRTLPKPDTLLGGLSIEAFLEHYWQKKPLLIRSAIPGFSSPVSPEQLMQLSHEDDVEARLVLEKGGDYPWQLLYGPFEEDFHDMPESHWSILVQEVNRYVPEVNELLESFKFIPSWRIDDVMVSYAPKDGGVGAHIDNYDVFLLQGMGHRRWQIMNTPVVDEVILPDLDVSILQKFRPDEDWILSPGDMLYLPPRIAHKGIAQDDCMTYSIGFRAPSHSEILASFLGYASEQLDPDERYNDPDLVFQPRPGEIQPSVLQKIRSIIRETIKDDTLIDSWFGSFITESQRGYPQMPPDLPLKTDKILAQLKEGRSMTRVPGISYAFIEEPSGDAHLFANGYDFLFPAPIAKAAPILCDGPYINKLNLSSFMDSQTFLNTLTEMINEGLLVFEEAV